MVFPFSGNVMQIYPGNAIGLGSARKSWKWREIQCRYMHWWRMRWESWNTGKALEEAEFADKDNANNLLFNSNGELENGEAYSNGMESGGVKILISTRLVLFNASNLSCLFFTAAVRVGYDPKIIWKEMRDMILNRGIPNGFLKENPHGIERLNTIPDAIQEMIFAKLRGHNPYFPSMAESRASQCLFPEFPRLGRL